MSCVKSSTWKQMNHLYKGITCKMNHVEINESEVNNKVFSLFHLKINESCKMKHVKMNEPCVNL